MRTTQTMTISLPPALLRQFEEICKAESRTRSELVREALRTYFERRYPVVEPTKAELAAIRRGRADYRRGSAVSLTQFLHELGSSNQRSGAKRHPKTAAKRASAR